MSRSRIPESRMLGNPQVRFGGGQTKKEQQRHLVGWLPTFDNIDQEALVAKLPTYSAMRQSVKGWLKAGVLEEGVFTPTEKGTPQGGVISPLLANIALHGMEEAIKEGYSKSKAVEKPVLVRFADDFVILHSSREAVELAAEKIERWLHDMGLHLNAKKTRLTHTLTPVDGQVGFNFLGFQVRQYPVGKTHTGRSANQWSEKKLGHRSQAEVIDTLNPVIRGWTNYYRTVVSSEVFSRCDATLYAQLTSWAKKKHPSRGKRWISKKYWRKIADAQWVYATPEGKKIRTHSTTTIRHHTKVKGTVSPYDGNLFYWYKRVKDHPLMDGEKAKLLSIQKGQCPRCGLYFREGDLLETDHVIPTAIGGKDNLSNKMVYHRHCHDEKTVKDLETIRAYKAAGISL